jgi:hypothetical protein
MKLRRMGVNLCYSHTKPDFEPGPYGIKTVLTRFHSHRSTCQQLKIPGATIRRRKHFGHIQNFCTSQTVQKSVLNPYRPGCKTLSQPIAWRTKQYTARVNAALHCRLMRVNTVRTGSIRISIRNWNPCKNFEQYQNFFLRRIVHSESIRNWHGLRCGSIRADPGWYGFNSVWTRLEIRLCVTAFTECRPHSKMFWPVWTSI